MTAAIENNQSAASIDPLDHISDRRRYYFDARVNATMVSVFQGDFYTSANPNEIITTVLGSCIAVCVRDPDIRFGGMNHFLLPNAARDQHVLPSRELRYGSYSIERLINAIMAHGGRRDRLEIKIFGGANLRTGSPMVGSRNAEFVEHYLQKEGLAITASDLRGNLPRRLRYYPATGKVLVSTAFDTKTSRIFEQEASLLRTQQLPVSGDSAEIFPRYPGPRPTGSANQTLEPLPGAASK